MKVLKSSRNPYIEANKRRNLVVVVVLLVVGECLILLGSNITQWLLLAAVLPVIAVPVFLRRYDIWKAGSKGESAVALTLQELDDSYYLLSSVVLPGRKRDIDHVVLGTKGVFVLESKNYSGKVVCDGDNWYRMKRRASTEAAADSLSKQVKRNASDLRNLIRQETRFNLHVNPILVFVNPSVELELNNPTVPVVRLGELNSFFEKAEPSPHLTKRQLEDLSESILKASVR